MNSIKTDGFDLELKNSYEEVFAKTCRETGLLEDGIIESLSFFDYDKNQDVFTPKNLQVSALLSGIQFSKNLQSRVEALQNKISEMLGPGPRFWVKPENLGVEYIVTKWPKNEVVETSNELQFLELIDKLELKKFTLNVSGFQFHSDGCVVLRGYDDGNILNLRKTLMEKFPWIPRQQSGWAHIPIGRLLTQLTREQHSSLVAMCKGSFENLIFAEEISSIHYVHESQWYMESKKYLKTKILD